MDETKKFNGWEVQSNGDLSFSSKNYVIEKDRLSDPGWILHLMSKDWVDFNDFLPAYLEALKSSGIDRINIKTNY